MPKKQVGACLCCGATGPISHACVPCAITEAPLSLSFFYRKPLSVGTIVGPVTGTLSYVATIGGTSRWSTGLTYIHLPESQGQGNCLYWTATYFCDSTGASLQITWSNYDHFVNDPNEANCSSFGPFIGVTSVSCSPVSLTFGPTTLPTRAYSGVLTQ